MPTLIKNTTGIAFLFCLLSCTGPDRETLFQRHESAKTGISFINQIIENEGQNIFRDPFLYNGGGVGLADFNNDGLTDIVFGGNQVSSRIYLNEGKLKFRDVSEQAGILTNCWVNGVSVVDINNDGFKDMYFSVGDLKDTLASENLLFVSQGLVSGIPVFKEMASQYGLNDNGFSTQAAFFDYDNDGDQDMYLLTNGDIALRDNDNVLRRKNVNGESPTTDRLYRNEGSEKSDNLQFKNVTREANILIEGFGLGVVAADLNNDGWQDIYVANDILSNDLVWMNNGNGTFTDVASQWLRHQSFNGMGVDIADFNNDALQDVLVLDMNPEDNYRKKMMYTSPNYKKYALRINAGYAPQFVRNTLQLNTGISPGGHLTFSEIGQLAGIHQTDWSWAPLFADFDNDGWKDLFISNGYRKDITDLDFISYEYVSHSFNTNQKFPKDFESYLDRIPEIKLSNYCFRNARNLTFQDVSEKWGLDDLSYSNGAAVADLDNDGDLDLVVSNIDQPVFIYENLRQDQIPVHYLKVELVGSSSNKDALGTKVTLVSNGIRQFYEHRSTRGYLSSMLEPIHFGIGNNQMIDSLHVTWPDGSSTSLVNVDPDRKIKVIYGDHFSEKAPAKTHNSNTESPPLYSEISRSLGVSFRHEEYDFVDFDINRLIPHKHSQYGPSIAVGDINGDDLQDFFIGGSKDHAGRFFIQQADGTFRERRSPDHTRHEDTGSLFFDADNDGDLDLYVASGSVEFYPGAKEFQDRLYINNGKGEFTYSSKQLPLMLTNSSCVKAADFDGDGDLDLFVGGHAVPGKYPASDRSYLLQNEKGNFLDVTEKLAPGLKHVGLVMDALWTDFDSDGSVDLMLTGEWMPIKFYKNEGRAFSDFTRNSGIEDIKGWWNSLVSADFDNDGDMDYVAGNLGLNSEYKVSESEPMTLFTSDFDKNGDLDPILTYYIKESDGKKRPHIVYPRDQLISQLPGIKSLFNRYHLYAEASLHDIFPERILQEANVLKANCFESSYLENLGNGRFDLTPLPVRAQFAPIFGMKAQDVTNDGNIDLLTLGNFFGADVRLGKYDAFNGLLLKGDGRGGFEPVNASESGFLVASDGKALTSLNGSNGEPLLIASSNRDSLKIFRHKTRNQTYPIKPNDYKAEIEYLNGDREVVEFYYGSSYLSQDSRMLSVNKGIKSIKVWTYEGKVRSLQNIQYKGLQ